MLQAVPELESYLPEPKPEPEFSLQKLNEEKHKKFLEEQKKEQQTEVNQEKQINKKEEETKEKPKSFKKIWNEEKLERSISTIKALISPPAKNEFLILQYLNSWSPIIDKLIEARAQEITQDVAEKDKFYAIDSDYIIQGLHIIKLDLTTVIDNLKKEREKYLPKLAELLEELQSYSPIKEIPTNYQQVWNLFRINQLVQKIEKNISDLYGSRNLLVHVQLLKFKIEAFINLKRHSQVHEADFYDLSSISTLVSNCISYVSISDNKFKEAFKLIPGKLFISHSHFEKLPREVFFLITLFLLSDKSAVISFYDVKKNIRQKIDEFMQCYQNESILNIYNQRYKSEPPFAFDPSELTLTLKQYIGPSFSDYFKRLEAKFLKGLNSHIDEHQQLEPAIIKSEKEIINKFVGSFGKIREEYAQNIKELEKWQKEIKENLPSDHQYFRLQKIITQIKGRQAADYLAIHSPTLFGRGFKRHPISMSITTILTAAAIAFGIWLILKAINNGSKTLLSTIASIFIGLLGSAFEVAALIGIGIIATVGLFDSMDKEKSYQKFDKKYLLPEDKKALNELTTNYPEIKQIILSSTTIEGIVNCLINKSVQIPLGKLSDDLGSLIDKMKKFCKETELKEKNVDLGKLPEKYVEFKTEKRKIYFDHQSLQSRYSMWNETKNQPLETKPQVEVIVDKGTSKKEDSVPDEETPLIPKSKASRG